MQARGEQEMRTLEWNINVVDAKCNQILKSVKIVKKKEDINIKK